MGMSVSASTGFENREFFMNSAKNRQGNETMEQNKTASNVQSTINLNNGKALTTEQYLMLASTQITVNNSLKETLKYLQKHANNRKKEYKFGDLWKILNDDNEDTEQTPCLGELIDIVIDNSKNIFVAA